MRHCVHEWTEICDSICNTSTCEGAVEVHPECRLRVGSAAGFPTHRRAGEMETGETAFSEHQTMVLDPRFKKLKCLSPDEVLHVQTKVLFVL